MKQVRLESPQRLAVHISKLYNFKIQSSTKRKKLSDKACLIKKHCQVLADDKKDKQNKGTLRGVKRDAELARIHVFFKDLVLRDYV